MFIEDYLIVEKIKRWGNGSIKEKSYYLDNKLHSIRGYAYEEYGISGTVYSKDYYLHGKKRTYWQWREERKHLLT